MVVPLYGSLGAIAVYVRTGLSLIHILAYFFSEPVVCNDAKGVGPLVLAYTEMIARK